VRERSIFRLLAEQGHLLFPDEMFDLYSSRGRRSIAPRVMATVMVLQRFEGLSDSEAVDRLHFDLPYKWACGLCYC
jgi:transposase